jgi:hypothetical protein
MLSIWMQGFGVPLCAGPEHIAGATPLTGTAHPCAAERSLVVH